MTRTIRPERSFENYSRGLELVRAIRTMWQANATERWYLADGRWVPPGVAIDGRIQALVAEFDLTRDEWFYWAEAEALAECEPSVEERRLWCLWRTHG